MPTLAVTGASGKTGWRVVIEALQRGWQVRAIVRPDSAIPPGLAKAVAAGASLYRLDIAHTEALHAALQGCDALVIATGARPSVDLLGPLKVDAFGVRDQIRSCTAVGLQRVLLVSSLCAGRWAHPLNLFGLILVWKRLGERWLERSGLDWTVIRPGGLSEDDRRSDNEGIVFSGPDQQKNNSIPRQLVAQVCVDALDCPQAVGQIVEITSRASEQRPQLAEWLATSGLKAVAP